MAVIRLHQNRINPLVLPVILAAELGYFKRYNVEVDLRLAEDFRFSNQDEFLAGEVDGMMGDTSFFFYYLEKGKEAQITSNLTRTIQIVGGEGITSDSEELVVGVNPTGLFRFFQAEFLTGPLATAPVKWLRNTYERIEAMSNKEINALVAIEPFVSDVLSKFNGEVLWHSRDIPNYFVMWCFDKKFVTDNPIAIRNFHHALEEAAQDFNQLTAVEKVKQCIEVAGYNEKLAGRMAEFQFEPQGTYREEDFNLLQDWMYREKEISHLYQPHEYIFKQ